MPESESSPRILRDAERVIAHARRKMLAEKAFDALTYSNGTLAIYHGGVIPVGFTGLMFGYMPQSPKKELE